MREEPRHTPTEIQALRTAEMERLGALRSVPDSVRATRPQGVLLSDEIEFYINNYQLVDPPKRDNIMAASYELRVGHKFAIGDKVYSLSSGDVLTFPKFEVVVVEILETINMPDFLIGRWNIRTRWAYEGLIWVGGPQVNPGFRGKIMCPLWNLSDKEISIAHGEAIAVMDFVTTTPPTAASNRLPLWNHRSRFVFEEYLTGLRSGLVTLVAGSVEALKEETRQSIESFKDSANSRLESHQNRMDTFTSVTFSALGILVAAVAIIATKQSGEGGSPQYWWDPTVFWLCSITAILTLFAFLRPNVVSRMGKWVIGLLACLAIGSIGLQLYHQRNDEQTRQLEINSLKTELTVVEGKNADLEQKISAMEHERSPTPKR